MTLAFLRLSRHRCGRRSALNRLLRPVLSLRRLLSLFAALLRFFLTSLSAVIPPFTAATLSVRIGGKTNKSYAADRDREAESV